METFGNRLRKRARELKLTDAEVARRAGLSERRYGNYVTGSREPDFGTFTRLCTALDTDPNDLLGFSTADKATGRDVLLSRIRAAVRSLDNDAAEMLALVAETLSARSRKKRGDRRR